MAPNPPDFQTILRPWYVPNKWAVLHSINSIWHEGGYFYLLVLLGLYFASWLLGGKSWHQSDHFDTLVNFLRLKKVAPGSCQLRIRTKEDMVLNKANEKKANLFAISKKSKIKRPQNLVKSSPYFWLYVL